MPINVGPVFPGESLTVSMWVDGNEAAFRTETGRGDVVLDRGHFTFDSPTTDTRRDG